VEIARRAGIAPEDVLRFDGNTPPDPPPTARPETIAAALERIQSYRHGGFPELLRAIADYNGVEPENVVLGPGADNLLMLCACSFAGPGDRIAIADEPSYPLYRVAAWVTGADVGDVDPVLTFVCRPHNPSGAMVEIPQARPLVVDEAYFEYGGETAVPLIGDGVIVVRTFSKAFGLASARVGYAVADLETAAELNERQDPAPLSTLSAALALAGLEAGSPDVSATIAERERLAAALRGLGLEPLPSFTNFVLVPDERAQELYEALLDRGLAVRPSPGALRITVHRPEANDRLLEVLASVS
jgi:histidinol-phosphate aminotransferase